MAAQAPRLQPVAHGMTIGPTSIGIQKKLIARPTSTSLSHQNQVDPGNKENLAGCTIALASTVGMLSRCSMMKAAVNCTLSRVVLRHTLGKSCHVMPLEVGGDDSGCCPGSCTADRVAASKSASPTSASTRVEHTITPRTYRPLYPSLFYNLAYYIQYCCALHQLTNAMFEPSSD